MEAFHLHTGDRENRAVSRALRFSLIAAVALATVLLVILATATANTALFQEHYPLLLRFTIGIAVALGILLLELLRRLYTRYRRGLFGTRLMARMATVFVLMTVIPVALIYVVAVQFIGRSIESWFDVPVEQALESGITLGRASLDSLLADLTQKARSMASEIADVPQNQWGATLNRLRDQAGVQEALVASGAGRIISASGNQYARLVPDLPSPSALRQVRITRLYAAYEAGESPTERNTRSGTRSSSSSGITGPSAQGLSTTGGQGGAAAVGGQGDLRLRVIVTIVGDAARPDEHRYLQLLQPVPTGLASNADAVQQGYAGYKLLSASRADLKKLYRITLSLIFLLTVFSAVAGAFLLAGWLTGPLSQLAAATRSVAEGDFRPVKDYSGRDELGVLTQSFNAMTRQLQDARELVDRNQRDLEQANARLESVLSNLNAGVLVLDSDLQLTLANPGADRILGVFLGEHLGKSLAEIPRVGELAEDIRAAFNEQAAAGLASWQRQFSLRREPAATGNAVGPPDGISDQTILARGSILPERRVGYVIVFDDITEVISAQRAVAWAEVARRLAHEIKNPLTPIQLAAERMQFKLQPKLQGSDAELLGKNAQTIVNQVAALKHLVDEFRDYARLPATQLAPMQLNPLIDDVMQLYVAAEQASRLVVHLAPDLPEVLGDRTQMRQVIHNLLKNALEAAEHVGDPHVELSTELVTLADGAPAVRLSVRDNGGGFSRAMLARAFEPYVTSKAKGTGLGLAIVKKIVDEHGARIDAGNWSGPDGRTVGAQVSILFTKLPKSVENRAFETESRG